MFIYVKLKSWYWKRVLFSLEFPQMKFLSIARQWILQAAKNLCQLEGG